MRFRRYIPPRKPYREWKGAGRRVHRRFRLAGASDTSACTSARRFSSFFRACTTRYWRKLEKIRPFARTISRSRGMSAPRMCRKGRPLRRNRRRGFHQVLFSRLPFFRHFSGLDRVTNAVCADFNELPIHAIGPQSKFHQSVQSLTADPLQVVHGPRWPPFSP
jgi:hypothetical protein